ncbi:hypothetical protein ACMC9I_09625 [Deinococcota bacterium DY0809b]
MSRIFLMSLLLGLQQAPLALASTSVGLDVVVVDLVRPDRLGLAALECVVDARGELVSLNDSRAHLLLFAAAEDLELSEDAKEVSEGLVEESLQRQLNFLHNLRERVRISIVVFAAYPTLGDVQKFPPDSSASLIKKYFEGNPRGATVYFECPSSLRNRLATKRPGPFPGLFLYVDSKMKYRLLGFPLRVRADAAALRVIERDIVRILSGNSPESPPLPLSDLGFDMDTAFPDLPEGRLMVLTLTGMEADPVPDSGSQAVQESPKDRGSWLKRVAAINRQFLDATSPVLESSGLKGVGIVIPPLAEAGFQEALPGRLETRWPGWRFVVLPLTAKSAVQYWELSPVLTDAEHRTLTSFFYATRPGATPEDTTVALKRLIDKTHSR